MSRLVDVQNVLSHQGYVFKEIEYTILGIVQGVTEMLPISSTAHVKFVQSLLGVVVDEGVYVVLNLGTLLSLLVFFKNDIINIINGLIYGIKNIFQKKISIKKIFDYLLLQCFCKQCDESDINIDNIETNKFLHASHFKELSKSRHKDFCEDIRKIKDNYKNNQEVYQSQLSYHSNDNQNITNLQTPNSYNNISYFLFAIMVAIATVPGVISGLLFTKIIQSHINEYENILIVINLIIFGCILFYIDKNKQNKQGEYLTNMKLILYLGVFQAVAVLPGVSRLGMCLIVCRYFNLSRIKSFELSMIFSLPITFAAVVYTLKDITFSFELVVGLCASFLSGVIFLNFVQYIMRFSFLWIFLYRIFFAIVVFLCAYYT